MPIKHDFDDTDDFARVMTLTRERLIPLIQWLDEQEDPEKKKITAAAFVLLFSRLVGETRRDRAEVMEELGIAYDMIVDGYVGGYDLTQDN